VVAQICETYKLTTAEFSTLRQRSSAAKATAYCPYSQFRVGATILAGDGQFVDGANVENAAYPVGTCAERVAFGKAVTEGKGKFRAVRYVSSQTSGEHVGKWEGKGLMKGIGSCFHGYHPTCESMWNV